MHVTAPALWHFSGFLALNSTDDEKSRNSGNSGENGRESGYGTAPSRLWNSPMVAYHQRYSYAIFICDSPIGRGI
ncbi:unnamed protein product [Gongylonema pulchrum]|uniref:Secreted protein n=1 Tax=Gongylonema pulchrum TaxID=637853 RepID=A0A183CZ85_9BILA|nr:unnamed protein product [Gongylonema pulchrum]